MTNSQWRLPTTTEVPPKFELEHCLVELDGVPRVAVWREGTLRWLSVAADEDRDFVRQVFVPVSTLNLKALAEGKASLRNTIEPAAFWWIIDEPAGDGQRRAWRTDEPPPPETLPTHDSLIPMGLRSELQSALGLPLFEDPRPVIQVESEPGVALPAFVQEVHGAPLAAAGRVLEAIGRLFERLSDGKVLTYAYAPAQGSLAVHLASNNPSGLEAVLAQYRAVTEGVTLAEDPARAFAALRPSVKVAFAAYFAEVASAHAEVFVRSQRSSSFITPRSARRFARIPPIAALDRSAYERRPVVGRLLALDLSKDKGSFSFHSTAEAVIHQGVVDPDVRDRMRSTSEGVEVGYRLKWLAVIDFPKPKLLPRRRPGAMPRALRPMLRSLEELREPIQEPEQFQLGPEDRRGSR